MIKKKCHRCFKPKPLDEFRKYRFHIGGSSKIWLEVDDCKECESEHGIRFKSQNNEPALQNFNEMRYTFSFIGKMPFKDLCKIYKVRYDK